MPDLDLFGEQVQRSERLSHAGRPRVPLRIMILETAVGRRFKAQVGGA
jgi:hypothetical protein